jgi:hypothetical protein
VTGLGAHGSFPGARQETRSVQLQKASLADFSAARARRRSTVFESCIRSGRLCDSAGCAECILAAVGSRAPRPRHPAGADDEAVTAAAATGRSRRLRSDTTDAELVALWLHGKSPTPSALTATTSRLSGASPASRCATYLSDLQRYADSLVGAPATRGRRLKTLKSLLSFATRMGYLLFNANAAIHGPTWGSPHSRGVRDHPGTRIA